MIVRLIAYGGSATVTPLKQVGLLHRLLHSLLQSVVPLLFILLIMSSASSSSTAAVGGSGWFFSNVDDIPIVFADVTPVDVATEPTPVAAIDYSADPWRTVFGYMRAVVVQQQQAAEYSPRTLKLTATSLRLNPANYTVWHFRRQCLYSLHSSLPSKSLHDDNDNSNDYIVADLELAASLGGDNPKNYQIWYHRRALLERSLVSSVSNNDTKTSSVDNNNNYGRRQQQFLNYVPGELEYLQTVLRADGKNYHAWSHRQWIVATATACHNNANRQEEKQEPDENDDVDDNQKLWNSEIDFINDMLYRDVRNNSAWNHRWFVQHLGGFGVGTAKQHIKGAVLSPAMATEEMEYALSAASVDPYNESCWVYFAAVLKEQVNCLEDASLVVALLTKSQERVRAVESDLLIDKDNILSDSLIIGVERSKVASRYLIGTLVDMFEWKSDVLSLREAIPLCIGLEQKHDVIRNNYWVLRRRRIQQALSEQERGVQPV